MDSFYNSSIVPTPITLITFISHGKYEAGTHALLQKPREEGPLEIARFFIQMQRQRRPKYY